MRKLKVKAMMSVTIPVSSVGGLLRSEYALRDRANPNIRSDKLSIRGFGLERSTFSFNAILLSNM
jgi:hypothetical protein